MFILGVLIMSRTTNNENRIETPCQSCGVKFWTTLNTKNEPARKDCKRCSFIRLAEYRINKIMTTFDQLANLSTGQYEKTDEDILKMKQAVAGKFNATFDKLSHIQSGTKAKQFTL